MTVSGPKDDDEIQMPDRPSAPKLPDPNAGVKKSEAPTKDTPEQNSS